MTDLQSPTTETDNSHMPRVFTLAQTKVHLTFNWWPKADVQGRVDEYTNSYWRPK